MYPSEPTNHSRRDFLKTVIGSSLALYLAGCVGRSDSLSHVTGDMMNSDVTTGHFLRDPGSIPPAQGSIEEVEVLIIGGGIAGLSALRWLKNSGMQDSLLLELEAHPGGNSSWGSSSVSAFPWAAHYLPIPDVRNAELLRFLEEAGCITGYSNGLPVYNEFHLCAAPEERLFINGYWQEGLIPATGISAAEQAQIQRFLRFTESLKSAKGRDGKDVFSIPLDGSSKDPDWLALDQITFSQYLDREGYNSKPLRWFLDYCCKDDYGLGLEQTSAWAGLHYFASRKGRSANAQSGDVLTWPQGNGFVMEALRQPHEKSIRTRAAAFKVEAEADGVVVHVYDSATKTSGRIRARKLVMAVPQFVARRMLPALADRTKAFPDSHTPWLVANLTVDGLPQGQGQGIGLCWDNVLYDSPSVGYVYAGHQQLSPARQQVISFYKPLLGAAPVQARTEARSKSWRAWLEEIAAELSMAHPGIEARIRHADIRIWGHGMAGPKPGYIWGPYRREAATPLDNRIFFAHTDYSGISLFEEAFYQGIEAARKILNAT